MAKLDDDARVRLWVALGSQPGASAWYAVWILSRLFPPALGKPVKSAPALTAPSPQTRRVRAGIRSHQEQPRP